MRIVYAGTPEFAAVPLQALITEGLAPLAVWTQPDRPAGRGRQLRASPVKELARAHGIPVQQPPNLREPDAVAALAALRPDLMVVIAYGLILPQAVLDLPRLGCINLHASLLPRWRGAAPIQRAIEAGDARTGLCLMQMDAGLDTGPVLARTVLDIGPRMTGGELHDALARQAAACLPDWLRALEDGRLSPEPQGAEGVSYAHKLERADALLDWSRPAEELDRRVRAFNPWPVAHTSLQGRGLRVWAAAPAYGRGAPGTVLNAGADGITVACGEHALRLIEVQWSGGRRISAAAAANGEDFRGCCLGS